MRALTYALTECGIAMLLVVLPGCGRTRASVETHLVRSYEGSHAVGAAARDVRTSTGGSPEAAAPSDGNAGGSGAAALAEAGGSGEEAGPPPLRFAVIGDFGIGTPESTPVGPGEVARLIHSLSPDFILTTGDNNYADVGGGSIDDHVGRFYADFVGSYVGAFGRGCPTNRFWPSLGNHDVSSGLADYLRFFTLPGNERYYDVEVGSVHLFAVDSDPSEPDGITLDSKQAAWLRARLTASTSCFDIVYFHHPPYTSGVTHGPTTYMRWPFAEWGADVVLSGHEHVYERLTVGGIPYVISGTGGAPRYSFGPPAPESVVRFTGDFGALLGTVRQDGLTFDYVTVNGKQPDEFVVRKRCGFLRSP